MAEQIDQPAYQVQEACIFRSPEPILASEMTLGEYLDLRCWRAFSDDPLNSNGFLIQHPGWGPPNDPNFEHFVSWMPRTQFLRTYDKVPETTH